MRHVWMVVCLMWCLLSGRGLLHADEVPLRTFSMEHGWITWGWEPPGADPFAREYVLQCAEVPDPELHAIGPRDYTVSQVYPITQIDIRMADLMNPGTWCCLMATLDVTGTSRRSISNEFCFHLAPNLTLQGTEKE